MGTPWALAEEFFCQFEDRKARESGRILSGVRKEEADGTRMSGTLPAFIPGV